MSQEKCIGRDVHQATISVAVMDAQGKLIMECLLETRTATIVEFIGGLHGTLSLTFEEGTSAAWLHDLLKPHVSRLVVCDPRKNALLKDGHRSTTMSSLRRILGNAPNWRRSRRSSRISNPGAGAYRKNGFGIIGKSRYGNRRIASIDRSDRAPVAPTPNSSETARRRFTNLVYRRTGSVSRLPLHDHGWF